jgi:hypothetical protein
MKKVQQVMRANERDIDIKKQKQVLDEKQNVLEKAT